MAPKWLFVSALALCVLVAGVSASSYSDSDDLESPLSAFRIERVLRGGPGGHPGHDDGNNPHIYNISLVANLSDSSSNRIGGVRLDLYFNNNTQDYDLKFKVAVKVPLPDSPTSALVLLNSSVVFNITSSRHGFFRPGFFKKSDWVKTEGSFRNLSTLQTAGGISYLAAVQAMIATPAAYFAQVQTTSVPAGIANGTFEAKVYQHGPPPLTYNISFLANLTNSKNMIIGGAMLNLYYNNQTSDYDLTYQVGAFINFLTGDRASGASVLTTANSSILFNITSPKGFFTWGFFAGTGGVYRNLTKTTLGAGTYLDAVNAMIASPSSFSVQLKSNGSPNGLAAGPVITKVFNQTDCHHGGAGGPKGPHARVRFGRRTFDLAKIPIKF